MSERHNFTFTVEARDLRMNNWTEGTVEFYREAGPMLYSVGSGGYGKNFPHSSAQSRREFRCLFFPQEETGDLLPMHSSSVRPGDARKGHEHAMGSRTEIPKGDLGLEEPHTC